MINRDLKDAGTKLLSWCAAKRRARSNKIWPKQKQIHWLSTCCSFQKTKQNKTKQKLKTFTIFYQLYFPDCIQVWKLLGKFQDFLKNSRFFTNLVLIISWTFALSNQTGEWHVISMEFLQWFPRRYFARKPEVASQNFVCFLRLLFHISLNTHTCTNKGVFTWHQGDFRPGTSSLLFPLMALYLFTWYHKMSCRHESPRREFTPVLLPGREFHPGTKSCSGIM